MSVINSFPNGGGEKIEIDSALSGTSENPVQNKAIKTELDKTYKTDDTAETALADADYIPFYDTSANGKRKTLWSNIKAVLKTYFDTLYQKALTAGNNITMSGTTINATEVRNNYSTSEQIIGTWIGGQTLYQRTFSTTFGGKSVEKKVATLDSNVRVVEIITTGFFNSTDGKTLAFIPLGGQQSYVQSNVVIVYAVDDDFINKPCYITIKYYKA